MTLPLLPLMVHSFGLHNTALLSLSTTGFSILNGHAVERLKCAPEAG